MMKTKAVIFDFDGVVCQTETYKLRQMANYYRSLGLKFEERQLYKLAGGNTLDKEAILDSIFLDQKEYILNKKEIMSYRINGFCYKDLMTKGIEDVFKSLKEKGVLIALASNSKEERLIKALNQCELLSYFNTITAADLPEVRKPNPWVYNTTLEKLKLDSENCLIVEDSTKGIRAGKAANIKVIALKDENGYIDQSEADVVIDNIKCLLEYII